MIMSGIPGYKSRMAIDFPWAILDLEWESVIDFLHDGMNKHVNYHWDGKIPSIGNLPSSAPHGLDCSGFVRGLIYYAGIFADHSSSPGLFFPDGSWGQEEFIKNHGFKTSTVEAGGIVDEYVRIAFLPALRGHARHVVLLYQGDTMECHGPEGHKGVDSQKWTDLGYRHECNVYVLGRMVNSGAI